MSYDPTVPVSGTSLATSRPLIQTNFATINSASSGFALEHVALGIAQAGLHKQVTFNANNAPAGAPIDPSSVAYTQPDSGGHPVLFYQTSQGSFQLSSNITPVLTVNNGQTFLPGGLIMKWGVTGNLPTGTTVNFSPAFPNACLNVTATQNAGLGANTAIGVSNFMAASFQYFFTNGANGTIYWLAIGY